MDAKANEHPLADPRIPYAYKFYLAIVSGREHDWLAQSRRRSPTPHHRISNEPIISLMTLDQKLFVLHLRPITAGTYARTPNLP